MPEPEPKSGTRNQADKKKPFDKGGLLSSGHIIANAFAL
jgi:hypothetical protein